MITRPNPPRFRSQKQDGFLLLGVLFMILLIMLVLAVAAPKMAEAIRRDKEEETIHRGKQYARAIQIFYKKYGRYPNTIDQLVKTENQRFLRKRYLDPMTGKDDWRIIHVGENKVPAMGLFGQATQQGGITQTGASTGIGGTSAGSTSPFGSSSSPGGGSSSLGSSGSGFGSSGSSFGAGSSTSPFGGNSGSGFGNSGSSTSPVGGTDSSGSGTSGIGFGSASGTGGTTTTGGTVPGIGGTQTTGSSGAFGSPGVSVGGAPIIGVGLLDKKTSIKIYKKQSHYNQWEFVFDPNQNTLDAVGGGAAGATGLNGTTGSGVNPGNGTSGFGNNNGSSPGSGFGSSNGSGFGSSNGSGFGSSNGSGSGSGSGFGGSPTSPVSPTTPVNNSPQ